mgnify:FL=1
MSFENLSSTEFLSSVNTTVVEEAPPASPFEVTQSETSLLATKAQQRASKAKAERTKLEAQLKDIEQATTLLQPDILKARRELAVAKKLQRVRNTTPEEIAAMEEALAHLEVEVEELNEQRTSLLDQIQSMQEQQQRALLLTRIEGFEFNLGTTRPILTLQLLSNLRRNLVYKQRYLEDAVTQFSTRIRDRAERVDYANGIVGYESQAERDNDRMVDLEAELAEVYSLQEVTGLLYDKVMPLVGEQQQQLLQWSPRDPISIQTLRREALEKELEKAEIQAEIQARRAAERTAVAGRRIRAA